MQKVNIQEGYLIFQNSVLFLYTFKPKGYKHTISKVATEVKFGKRLQLIKI